MNIEPSLRVCGTAYCTWPTFETKYGKPRVGFRPTKKHKILKDKA